MNDHIQANGGNKDSKGENKLYDVIDENKLEEHGMKEIKSVQVFGGGDLENIDNNEKNIADIMNHNIPDEDFEKILQSYIKLPNYDPNGPVDLVTCGKHQKAQYMGKPLTGSDSSPEQKEKAEDRCYCCDKLVNKTKLSLCNCFDQSDNTIGYSMKVYFRSLWYYMVLMLIKFILCDQYTIVVCWRDGQWCVYNHCSGDFAYWTPANLNARHEVDDVSRMFSFITFILFYFFYIIVVYYNEMCLRVYKSDIPSNQESKYTVMIDGIPNDQSESDIKEYFESLTIKYRDEHMIKLDIKPKVISANMTYYVSKQMDAEKERLKFISKYINYERNVKNFKKADQDAEKEIAEKSNEANPKEVNKLKSNQIDRKKKIEDYTLKAIIVKKKLVSIDRAQNKAYSLKDKFQFTGTAFVTFETEQQAMAVIKEYSCPFYQKPLYSLQYKFHSIRKLFVKSKYKGASIEVHEAPDADAINWENFGLRHNCPTAFDLATYILISSLSMGSVFISYLQVYDHRYVSDTKRFHATCYNQGVSLTITISTKVIKYALDYCQSQKKFETKSQKMANQVESYTSLQIANYIFTPVLAHWFVYGNDIKRLVYDTHGMQYLYFNLIWSTFAVQVALDLFNPKEIMRRVNIFKLKRNLEKFNLRDAIKKFTPLAPDIVQWYGTMNMLVAMCLFCMPILPISSALCLLSLFGMYWSGKISYFRRMRYSDSMGTNLTEFMIKFHNLGIFMGVVGHIFFDKIILDKVTWSTWCVTAFFIIWYLFDLANVVSLQIKEYCLEKERKKYVQEIHNEHMKKCGVEPPSSMRKDMDENKMPQKFVESEKVVIDTNRDQKNNISIIEDKNNISMVENEINGIDDANKQNQPEDSPEKQVAMLEKIDFSKVRESEVKMQIVKSGNNKVVPLDGIQLAESEQKPIKQQITWNDQHENFETTYSLENPLGNDPKKQEILKFMGHDFKTDDQLDVEEDTDIIMRKTYIRSYVDFKFNLPFMNIKRYYERLSKKTNTPAPESVDFDVKEKEIVTEKKQVEIVEEKQESSSKKLNSKNKL